MSVTSGFFNSVKGDRRYFAEHISSIFDGIINDGVFANIGTAFSVKASSGNNITVGIGRAWFNSKWINNDSILPLTAELSDVLLDRYDAVVIEVDSSEAVRNATIKIVTGVASSTPQTPTLINTDEVHQYMLCHIYRAAGSSEIRQADITNTVGTGSTPYVTGILEVLGIENIVAQWKDQWDEWFENETEEDANEFYTWFKQIKGSLGEDAAATLAAHIADDKNPHGVTASEIGAAASDHKHTKSEITDFPTTMTPSSHKHTKSEITDFPTTMTPSSHKHTKSEITDFPTSMTPSSHKHDGSDINNGTTLPANIFVGSQSSDSTLANSQLRNIKASTTDLTPGTSSLANGTIYVVYE